MRTQAFYCIAITLLLITGCEKRVDDEITTPLHKAVAQRDMQQVQILIQKGADLEARNFSGRTPLHEAVKSGNVDIAALLVDRGANINAPDKWGYSPLHRALEGYSSEMVELLLTLGAEVKTQADNGETPLHAAARRGEMKFVELLVARGLDVNAAARNGNTPLLCAVGYSETPYNLGHAPDYMHMQVIRFLIAKGTDVNAMNKDGETPLSRAALHGDLELTQLLLDNGAEPNRGAAPDRAPAMLAMNRNHLAVAKLLVERGADVALHLAVYVGDVEKAQALLGSGAAVDEAAGAGQMLLYTAVYGGHRAMTEWLIDGGADVNARDEVGWTPLHVAARHGHKDVAELLLARGAEVNAKIPSEDNEMDTPLHSMSRIDSGMTPLHLASRHAEVAKVLIANGADVNAKCDDYDMTPVQVAVSRGNRQVVELLIDAGADVGLHVAASVGHIEKVKQLIDAGADLNARDDDGRTPVLLAVIGGYADVVEALAKNGADPNVGHYDEDGRPIQTPLHEAIQLDDLDMARLLIAYGASIHAQRGREGTLLHLAACGGNASMVGLLLSHGADPNAKDWDGKTPRDCAQDAGFKDVIRLLNGDIAKAKADPYRTTITDPNEIQLLLGRTMTVGGVWTPDETQLQGFEAALQANLRGNSALCREHRYVLGDLRRCHREYAGYTSKGTRYIVCNLVHYDLVYYYPDAKPLPNGFSGRSNGRWRTIKVIFDVDSRTISHIRDLY